MTSARTEIVPLRLAVCLFPAVTALDFQGPIELLGFLSPESLKRHFTNPPSHSIETTYFSHNLDLVKPSSGPLIQPDRSYSDTGSSIQYDILLVPGGMRVAHTVRQITHCQQ